MSNAKKAEMLRENLLLTLNMFESGLTLMRERLRRLHPKLSQSKLEKKLIEWLAKRPPDAPGKIVQWPNNAPSST